MLDNIPKYLRQNLVLVNIGCLILFALTALCCVISVSLLSLAKPQGEMLTYNELVKLKEDLAVWRGSVADRNLYNLYFLDLPMFAQLEKLKEAKELFDKYENMLIAMGDLQQKYSNAPGEDMLLGYTVETIYNDILDLDGHLTDHLCKYRSPKEVVFDYYKFNELTENVKLRMVERGEQICRIQKLMEGNEDSPRLFF